MMKRKSRWNRVSNSFSSCTPSVPPQRKSYTSIFLQRVFLPLLRDRIEETLHIAVNTPQLLEVPKKLRPVVLQLLREQLQKYVMGQLSGTTDDVELMSHRQVEANQFRSRVLREVPRFWKRSQRKKPCRLRTASSIVWSADGVVCSAKWTLLTRRRRNPALRSPSLFSARVNVSTRRSE